MIDQEQVRKVAHLARLQLSEDEEIQFSSQLSSILDYFEQLSELNTDEVQPTARAIDVSNVTRVDKLETWGDRPAILNCAPDREDEFFKVPQILGTED